MSTVGGYDVQARPGLAIQCPSSISMKLAETVICQQPTTTLLNSAKTLDSQQPNPAEKIVWRNPNPINSAENTICEQPNHLKLAENNITWDILSLEETFLAMAQSRDWPPLDSYLCALQKCRKTRSLAHAMVLHGHICSHGVDTHYVLESHLVSLFVECGSMPRTPYAFNRLCQRSEFTWTCLMQGYVDSGEPQHALDLVQGMKDDGIVLTRFTYATLLKACARLQCLEIGQNLHKELREMGLESDLFVGSTLVDMYAKCGALEKAQHVFDGLSSRNIVSWTALIAGYAEHGPGEKALKCLEQMCLEGVSPDTGSFICSLKACKSLEDLHEGFVMHSEIVKKGFEEDQIIGHALMDMYAKCSLMEETRDVFNKLPAKNVVSWTTLIARYAEYGHNEEALECLNQMQVEGECPNDITLVCSLKACRDLGVLDKGQEIHAFIVREELEKVPYVCNTLVDFYANHGQMEEARQVFQDVRVRDVILWTTLITGYAECEFSEEALSCFQQMKVEGFCPDVVSFNAVILGCAGQVKSEKALSLYLQMQEQGLLPNNTTVLGVLKACKNKSALASGKKVHAQILTSGGQTAVEVQLATVLFDMYAKCGNMQDAQHVFDSMPSRDTVSWTALITGYAGRGESGLVFELLERMMEEGTYPDGETFLSVLIACTHAGLVDDAQMFFESMGKDFGVIPTLEHLNCVVDLLGRVGRLNEAVSMLHESLIPPDQVMWGTVLSACRKWHDVQVARHAFECAMSLDKSYTSAYSLMANIYADAQLWEEMKVIEGMRAKHG